MVFSLSSEQISNNEREIQAIASIDSEADNGRKRRRVKVKPLSGKGSDWERLRTQQRQNLDHLAYQDSRTRGDTAQHEEKMAIDYMAKDYASFRAALLDLIPRKIPQWKDKSEADIGIMLIELFSYIADELSYFQDRVANEAFLRTARSRSSLSSHLSLIDYRMQNGLAANAFIKVKVKKCKSAIIPAGFQVSTYPERGRERGVGESAGIIVFETLEDQVVDFDYNRICVEKINNSNNNFSSIMNPSAILRGRFPELKKGQYLLLFEEASIATASAKPIAATTQEETAVEKDVHPEGKEGGEEETLCEEQEEEENHLTRIIMRQAIVKLAENSKIITYEGNNNNTLITWEKGSEYPKVADGRNTNVICCANIIKASHGRTIRSEILKQKDQEVSKFLFTLEEAPLTFISDASSSSSIQPFSTLKVWVDGEPWQETDSLLKCGPLDQKFSITIDEDGFATILFGDGKFGLKPEDDSLIVAEYRVGSGSVGNVGKDTLTQFEDDKLPQNSPVLVQQVIDSVTNPFPATGGIDIEPMDDAKIAGPKSLKELERAVTLKDYEDLAKREFQNEITNASARFVFTGSWDTIFVSVDLKGQVGKDSSVDYSEPFDRIRKYLDRVKMIGYEVQIEEAKYVPIEIGITVFLRKYFDSEILRDRIRSSLGNKEDNSIVDGSRGLFHPDNFTFGDPVYASKIYEVLKNAPEVKYGVISTFRKRHTEEANAEYNRVDIIKSSSSPPPLHFSSPDAVIAQRDEETKRNLEKGYIPINKNEIITVDNDPLHPENGILILNFVGDNESKQQREEGDHDYEYSLWDDHN